MKGHGVQVRGGKGRSREERPGKMESDKHPKVGGGKNTERVQRSLERKLTGFPPPGSNLELDVKSILAANGVTNLYQSPNGRKALLGAGGRHIVG